MRTNGTLMNARDSESTVFTWLLRTLRTWWWVLILVAAVAVGVAYAVLDRVQPVYRATATVLVSPTAPRVLDDVKEVVDLAEAGRRDFDEYMQTQLDIIKSQGVSEEVLDSLDLWADPRLFGADPGDEDAQTMRLVRSSDLAGRIKPRRVIDALIIQIPFEHRDPVLSALMANEFARVYVDQNLESKRDVLTQARVELERVLTQAKTQKADVEERAELFEQQNDMAAAETRRAEVAREREFYNRKVLESRAKLVEAEAQLAEAERVGTRGIYGVAIPEVMGSPVLNALKVSHSGLRNDVSELEITFLEKHPKLLGAKHKLTQVQAAIASETRGIVRSIRAKADASRAEFEQFSAQFEVARKEDEALGLLMDGYEKIQKELKEQTARFDRLRKRYDDTALTGGTAMNNVRMLDRALVPQIPVWPRRTMILAAASLLGLLLGVALVLLLERSDTTIRDKAHAEEVLDIPCLGVIPTIPVIGATPDIAAVRTRDLYVFDHHLSEPAEQVRTLRTNLLFLGAGSDRKLKTLLVTSALPEEGKTTIAIQTSVTLATADERVILIEADMRRPRIAATLNLAEDRGLSTFLAAPDTRIEDVIQHSHIPNLDVIPCGAIPPNPAELLNHLRLNVLLARLHERYDKIVIDSPPVNAVSDALVMASRVDGLLLVAKAKRTTADALRAAYSALRNVNAPLIGTVLNDVHRGSLGYYRKGKYYRAGYYKRSPEELEAQARRVAGGDT